MPRTNTLSPSTEIEAGDAEASRAFREIRRNARVVLARVSGAAEQPEPFTWDRVIEQMGNWSPEHGATVARMAKGAGFKAEEVSGYVLAGAPLDDRPQILIQSGERHWRVSRKGVASIGRPWGNAQGRTPDGLSDEWLGLADAALTAWALFDAACAATDSVVIGREPTEEEEAAWDAANDTAKVAIDAALAYRPRNFPEYLDKQALFSRSLGHGIEKDRLAAAEADVAALARSTISADELVRYPAIYKPLNRLIAAAAQVNAACDEEHRPDIPRPAWAEFENARSEALELPPIGMAAYWNDVFRDGSGIAGEFDEPLARAILEDSGKSDCLTHSVESRAVASVYLERMADDFDPRAWLDAYEALGGHVYVVEGPDGIEGMGQHFARDGDSEAIRQLERELMNPFKREAVSVIAPRYNRSVAEPAGAEAVDAHLIAAE